MTNARKKRLPERRFGIAFCVVFTVIGFAPKLGGWRNGVHGWALAISLAFLFFALAFPVALKPLRKLWERLGELLHIVSNHVIIGALFFLAITPIAAILRAFGKSPLALRRKPDNQSYWIVRAPAGSVPDNMRNQF